MGFRPEICYLAPQNEPSTGELTTLAIRWVKMGVDRAETWSYGPK